MNFKMPTKSTLRQRKSTIANAFAISITPYIKPTNKEIENLLELLKIDDGKCVYCLGRATTTDHFRPLVEHSNPTGYISDVNNLVPCCSTCNSSKGKKKWDEWYLSEKNLNRLLSLGLTNIEINERYQILKKYSDIGEHKLNYKEIVGEDMWNEFLQRKNKLNKMLDENQIFCDRLNLRITNYLKDKKN